MDTTSTPSIEMYTPDMLQTAQLAQTDMLAGLMDQPGAMPSFLMETLPLELEQVPLQVAQLTMEVRRLRQQLESERRRPWRRVKAVVKLRQLMWWRQVPQHPRP